MKPKIYTVCYPLKGSLWHVLIGRHKDTPGARKLKMVDLFNGFGGKLDPAKGDRNVEDCAIREVKEECGLSILPSNLFKAGVILFDNPGTLAEVHFFFATAWTGEPLVETEEMRDIGWYHMAQLPYSEMMDADRQFKLPYELYNAFTQSKILRGRVAHDEHMKVKSHEPFVLETRV
jgi:8-oxo-dGTP pyrophosphatase MutT (NUDIX family)